MGAKIEIGVDDLINGFGGLLIILGLLGGKLKDLYYKHKKKKKSSIKVSSDKLKQIHEKLTECRIEFDASRVTITQFHNGDYYYSTNSILKMSVTHESTDQSTSKIMDDYQSLSANKYHKFLTNLVNSDFVYYKDVNLEQTDHEDDMLLDLQVNNNTTFIACKLLSKEGNIIGFITMSFVYEKEELDIKRFKEYVNMISFLLRN